MSKHFLDQIADRPDRQPDVLYIEDMCALLGGISVDTFARWRKAGKVPDPMDLPGRPRWQREDIDNWLEGRRRERRSLRRVI